MVTTLMRVIQRGRHGLRLVVGWRRVQREMVMVEAAYQSELARPIDRLGALSWRLRIAGREVTGSDAVDELRTRAEYVLSRTGFYHNLHRGRMQWAAALDAFDCILDIGGSSPSCPDGALMELGYAHRPSELHILDRPEDEQFHGRPNYDQSLDRVTEWGTISFHHGLAEEIDKVEALTECSFDCVIMGQTIEHIKVDRLPLVLGYVRRHLRPGGRLIFDTPNRDLTRLVVGEAMLSKDHTYEYTPAEMVRVLRANGFEVIHQIGIVPMPQSAASGKFDWQESETPAPIVDDPADCFVFAFECAPLDSDQ